MKFCGLVILLFVLSLGFLILVDYLRLRRLAEQRKGETYYHFAAHFIGENVPEEILRNTYDYFHDWSGAVSVPVRASDNIDKIYGISDEDLDEAVEAIITKSGRRLPTEDELENFPLFETVEDIVLFVAASPKIDTESVS
jgi:hypothetical protein